MSALVDEKTKLKSKLPAGNKIYDLRSQLSMKKRNDDIIIICKKQFYSDLFLTLLSISSSEEFYREEYTVDENNNIVFTKQRNHSDTLVTSYRVVNIVLTIGIRNTHLVYFIYRHYVVEVEKMINRKVISKYDSLKTSGLFPYMILEMVVQGIFCPPYFDYEFSGTMLNGTYTYSIEIIISIITMLRILQVIRIYQYFSVWLSPEAFELGKKLNIAPNLLFSIKSDLKFQPQLVLVPTIGMLVLIMGYAVRNLERPYVSDTKCSLDFDYLTNGFWLAIVTMCTIGYGDGYPSTHLGRFIMVLTAAISLVAISLYIVALNIATLLTKEQSKAFYMIKDLRGGNIYKHNASNVIKSVFVMKKLMIEKDKPDYLRNLFVASAMLKKQFHHFTGKFKSSSKYLPPTEMIMQLEHKLVSDINFIKKEIIDIDYIGDRLEELIKLEELASDRIDEILNDQEKIENMIEEMDLGPWLKNNRPENNLS